MQVYVFWVTNFNACHIQVHIKRQCCYYQNPLFKGIPSTTLIFFHRQSIADIIEKAGRMDCQLNLKYMLGSNPKQCYAIYNAEERSCQMKQTACVLNNSIYKLNPLTSMGPLNAGVGTIKCMWYNS